MAQTSDRARLNTKPWAGTIDQLQRAARTCAARIVEAVPWPDGTDADHPPSEPEHLGEESIEDWRERYQAYLDTRNAWSDAKRQRDVSIVVVEDNFTRTLTAIDDLSDLPREQLPRTGVISIEIGGNGYQPTSAKIEVSRRDGLQVTITGLNRTWTAGLRHEVEQILKPRTRLRPPLAQRDELLGVAAALLFSVVWLALLLVFYDVANWPRGLAIALSLVLAALAAAVPVMIASMPSMEILAPDAKPRYQRWRGKILSAAGALLISIAGAVLVAVFLPSPRPPASHGSQHQQRRP